jgi:hypothetical protein
VREQAAALTAELVEVTARLEAALAEIERLKGGAHRQETPSFSVPGRATA